MIFYLEIEIWNMFIFLFWVGVEILSNKFFLEAHNFERPSSVELFALSKEWPWVYIRNLKPHSQKHTHLTLSSTIGL